MAGSVAHPDSDGGHLGRRVSKGRIRLERSIRARPTTVFAFLTNLERVPEWDQRVTSVRKMTQGQLRSGVILRSTLTVDGEAVHADDEVTDYDPPNRLGLRSVLGSTDSIFYTLSEIDNGDTAIDVVLTYDLPDLPGGSGTDADGLQVAIAAALNHSLELLGALVEKNASALA